MRTDERYGQMAGITRLLGMASANGEGWSFATAREPDKFTACIYPSLPSVEHAMGHGRNETLCGIPGDQVVVYRHLFSANGAKVCHRCGERAALAPDQPCGQERLHDEILAADPGPLRDELVDALRGGADIPLWINGPAVHVKSYVKLENVDDSERIAAMLNATDRIGIARVVSGPREFIIVLPATGNPVIARTIATAG